MSSPGALQPRYYGPEDEHTHSPAAAEAWQESVVLIWWDFENRIGGLHRLGHEPNRNGGQAVIFSIVWTPEWVYKLVRQDFPLNPQTERSTRMMAGGNGALHYDYDGVIRWRIEQDEVSLSLAVTDYHAPLNPFTKVGDMAKDMASDHTEASGTVSGHVVMKGKRYEVRNALAYRDHSWGIRNWEMIKAHRWLVGNLGPDFNFCVIAYLDANQKFSRFGYLLREGKLQYCAKVESVTYIEDDAFTHRGGVITMTLEDGEKVVVTCEPLAKGMYAWAHHIATLDTLCRATCGKYSGFCDYEITGNYMQGTVKPMNALNAYRDDGIFPAELPLVM